jgi:hypothetical protein
MGIDGDLLRALGLLERYTCTNPIFFISFHTGIMYAKLHSPDSLLHLKCRSYFFLFSGTPNRRHLLFGAQAGEVAPA